MTSVITGIINMIIADDHKIFIDGLKLLLKDEPDMKIQAVAGDGRELLDMLPKYNPDIVLLDINMPVINGLETGKMIKQKHPHIKFMMLSTYNDDHLIEKARKYGANAYVLKTANKDELLKSIRCVYKGGSCFPEPSSFTSTKTEFDEQDKFLKQFDLTKRELEILRFIKKDLSNQEIADELYLSIYTVQTHRKNIMNKLNLNTSTALMKFIIENNV